MADDFLKVGRPVLGFGKGRLLPNFDDVDRPDHPRHPSQEIEESLHTSASPINSISYFNNFIVVMYKICIYLPLLMRSSSQVQAERSWLTRYKYDRRSGQLAIIIVLMVPCTEPDGACLACKFMKDKISQMYCFCSF
jgi:hypothetical protein